MKKIFADCFSISGRPLTLIVFTYLFSFSVSSGQNKKIDSLMKLLPNKTGGEYHAIIYQLSIEQMRAGNYDEALRYCRELKAFGEQEGDSLQLVRGVAITASVMRRRGLIDSAMYFYDIAYPIAKRNSYQEEYKNVTNSIGLLYAYQGYYDKALKLLFESLTIRERRLLQYSRFR
jgi:tetratricopeptide (TPR) repeat protein